jgi:DNA-binding NtrC family response regulator
MAGPFFRKKSIVKSRGIVYNGPDSTLQFTALATTSHMSTILIVDDDDAIRETLYDLLSDRYECHTASRAEEALQYLAVEKYDAVLTDIALPGLTGLELLHRVQQGNSGTPVILISGKGAEQDGDSLIRLGAFAYVTKPFSLDQIELVVERAVEQKLFVGSPEQTDAQNK